MDKNTKFECEKCKKVVDYISIEGNLDLGMHTEEHPIIGSYPYVHKNCGGIVHELHQEN